MTVVDTLVEHNAVFRDQRFRPGLPLLPQLRTLIVGCVDPRVDPAVIFGLDLGEAGIIRNVGGRITPGTLDQIALLMNLTAVVAGAGAPRGDLIVLQHIDCGITRLLEPPDRLAGYFGIDPSDLDGVHVTEPYEAVRRDIEVLRGQPSIVDGYRLHGAVFDVRTGRVDVVHADPQSQA
jgi:carbonic anhydrase